MTTDTTLSLECPACQRTYTVRRELFPVGGARIRCKRCHHAFTVRPEDLPVTASAASETAPPRRVWVFTGDPAVHRSGIVSAFDATTIVETLDEKARGKVVAKMFDDVAQLPTVVVFGDMHVLLRDELLRLATRTPTVVRIRVSSHDNQDLTSAARAYCGFDVQVTLPLTESQVRDAAQAAVGRNHAQRATA